MDYMTKDIASAPRVPMSYTIYILIPTYHGLQSYIRNRQTFTSFSERAVQSNVFACLFSRPIKPGAPMATLMWAAKDFEI